MKNTLFLIVQKLLSKNNISYDKKELSFQIQSHPSFPSLHAITGVLNHFNIENVAAEVPSDEETLAQLPNAFIAEINTDGATQLATISTKNGKTYTIYTDNHKEEKLTKAEFLKQFTGIIVAVEKTKQDEKSSGNGAIKELVIFSLISILTATLLVMRETDLQFYLFLGSTVAGIIASYSILKQELGQGSLIGDAFCSSNTIRKDCNVVLDSGGAKIIKGHKLSDLSIIYFVGQLIILFLTSNFQLLFFISLLALPVTFYSIYYQHKIVKTWCTLCLTIVGILWLQVTLGILQLDTQFSFPVNIPSVIMAVLGFISTYLIWHFTKPLVSELIELKHEKVQFTKFKRNFDLFNSLLQKSSRINTEIFIDDEILLGNIDADLEIVVVTNPFCGHCKPAHELVNNMLKRYKDIIKVIIRFNVPVQNPDMKSVIVSERLLELDKLEGTEICKQAMNDIYGTMDYEEWLLKWNKAASSQLTTLKTNVSWCQNNDLNFTPEILINGKSYPVEYERTDLIHFIEDLAESSEQESPVLNPN